MYKSINLKIILCICSFIKINNIYVYQINKFINLKTYKFFFFNQDIMKYLYNDQLLVNSTVSIIKLNSIFSCKTTHIQN